MSEELGNADPEEGIEAAFEVVFEINDQVTSAVWINDVFFYTNANGKLQYAVAGKAFNFALVDRSK